MRLESIRRPLDYDAEGRKNHLALGAGEIDIEKYTNLAKEQNCRVVLETKTIDGLRQSVEWLKKLIDMRRTVKVYNE